MKFLKALILALSLSVVAFQVDAGSIGRSGGSSSSFSSGRSSSSFSSSSSSSRSSAAPAPSKPTGIGSTASYGVSKPDVTNGVRSDVAKASPAPTVPSGGTVSTPHSAPAPSYGYAPTPAPTVIHHDSGGGFGSSFAGSMMGSMLGNAISRPAAPVVVGGGGYAGPVVAGTSTVVENGTVVQAAQPVVVQKSYGIGQFILDVILFGILLAVLAGLAFLIYKGLKMTKSYVNTERGIDNNPFAPTERFWKIQKAFAAADKAALQSLLGPDIKDELIDGIEGTTELDIHKVSHEVRLLNNREFSIWYKFDDGGENVNQVWHFEKIAGDWKLNGIETI